MEEGGAVLNRKRKNLLLKATILVFLLGFHIAGTGLTLKLSLEPETFRGTCPCRVNLTITFKTEKDSVLVKYRIIRSDGILLPERRVFLEHRGVKQVVTTLSFKRSFSGWIRVETLQPEKVRSNRVYLHVMCSNREEKKPDLLIFFKAPPELRLGERIENKFLVMVKNDGKAEARDFYLEIVLKSSDGKRFSCGKGYVPYIAPASSAVPAKLSFQVPRDLTPGEYEICGIVDPDNRVKESNENNNRDCHPVKVKKEK